MSLLRKILGGEEPFVDPVCGMKLPASHGRDFVEYQGKTYHFCSTVCREQFEREPEKYLAAESTSGSEASS